MHRINIDIIQYYGPAMIFHHWAGLSTPFVLRLDITQLNSTSS